MTFDDFLLRGAILAICFCAVLEASVVLAGEPRLPDQPKDYAVIVDPQLPPGWHCTHDFSTLVISHDEPVTYLNSLGLPNGEHNDEFFKKYGGQGPYLIVMKFVSRLSEADQRALADRRRQAIDEARKGREHEKYSASDVYNDTLFLSISTTGSASICMCRTHGL